MAIERRKCIGKIAVGFEISLSQGDRAPIRRYGFIKFADGSKRYAEVIVGLGKVRTKAKRLAEACDRFRLTTCEAQGVSQIVMQFSDVRSCIRCLLEMRNGLTGTAEHVQGIAKIVARLDIAGIDRQDVPIFYQCFIKATESRQQHSEIVVRIARSRVLHQRAANQVLGLLGTAELSGNDAQVMQGAEMIAVDIKNRAVQRVSLAQPPQPVKRGGSFESLLRTEAVR